MCQRHKEIEKSTSWYFALHKLVLVLVLVLLDHSKSILV
jgi:hypothetical protein